MKKTDANTHIEVMCHCPYCNSYQDVLEEVKEVLDETHSAENIDIVITCDECKKEFLVGNVDF